MRIMSRFSLKTPYLKKSLEARHLPGEVHVCAFFSQKHHNIKILRLSRYTSTSASALYMAHA